MYVDGEVIEKMIVTILEGFERIERKLDRMNRLKDCFDGDELLDNVDLCNECMDCLFEVAAMRFVFILTREWGSP